MQPPSEIRLQLVARRRALLDQYLEALERELDIDLEPTRYDAANFLQLLGSADAQALHEVSKAIERFDAGAYGRCLGCWHDIGQQRLETLPTVTLCFVCASHAAKQAA